MKKRDEYLREISRRGDQYGGRGGLLDLLTWSGKKRLLDVTEEDARRFLADPCQSYGEAAAVSAAETKKAGS